MLVTKAEGGLEGDLRLANAPKAFDGGALAVVRVCARGNSPLEASSGSIDGRQNCCYAQMGQPSDTAVAFP
jgi:hypothetical protein